ncbi:unnamed protein product [Vicia faba]|uniref:Uncharacterized protein n=1 Tax=Vicia faba TaxID=3906 RepID=A0AAV0ZSZ2_VICFA|nr:unnamed protein product [Vicia faba]
MASSSRSYQTHLKNTQQDFNFFKDEKSSKPLQDEEEREEDWLKLGLGLGTSTSSSLSPWKKIVSHNPILISPSSLSSTTSQQQCFPQIGLGLGFEDHGLGLESRKGKERLEDLNFSNDHQYHHDDDNSKVIGLSSLSLSSSCEIMNPRGEDLAFKFPSDSHHYLARNIHNQSGFWFTLRSFTNRNGEALPQISKEYIRVKDENMTVLMVKKYLVTKLGLSNEDEVKLGFIARGVEKTIHDRMNKYTYI